MVTQQSGALGGQLGSRTQLDSTFHGSDPETVAAAAICSDTPTKCQARTRLYRDGTLVAEGFPVSEISDHLTDERATIWLDLRDPDPEDLAVLGDEFGLHPVARRGRAVRLGATEDRPVPHPLVPDRLRRAARR